VDNQQTYKKPLLMLFKIHSSFHEQGINITITL
jgi:hypothetical protein